MFNQKNSSTMIFTPLNEVKGIKDVVFLAGPCPRAGQDWEDWRGELCNKLESRGFRGDLINPTNPKYDTNDPTYYDKQCTWETNGLNIASCIVFWIDRNDEHPALTTNIEFGIWSDRAPKSLVVGVPEGSEHCGYIKWVCEKKGIACFDTMDKVADEVVRRFSGENGQQLYFTSDTHFGSDRHLELSKRPFLNVADMDLTFISNWNKTVTSNDIVFHLGDFGDLSVLQKLNFKKMFLLKGNYEHDIKDFCVDDPRVVVCDNNDNVMKFVLDGEEIPCVHEPLFDRGSKLGDYFMKTSNKFFLYGHIHEKGLAKHNGLNVGIDAHNYKPISVDVVRFYKNAIQIHYDGNVFCDSVGLAVK